MAIVRVLLSGSPPGPATGRVIPVVAITTPGTTIHTAHATSLDAMYLWASNVTRNEVALTIEWGGVLNPGDRICNDLVIRPNSEPRLIVGGQVLTGGLLIKAFASKANAINIGGFCSRIT